MIKRISLNKDNYSKAFMQEYSVFTALAPEKLVNLFDAEEISFPEYYKLICLLTYFNFSELLLFCRTNPNHNLSEEDGRIFEEGSDDEFEAFIEEKGWELDDEEYINLFKENIESNMLKKFFSSTSN